MALAGAPRRSRMYFRVVLWMHTSPALLCAASQLRQGGQPQVHNPSLAAMRRLAPPPAPLMPAVQRNACVLHQPAPGCAMFLLLLLSDFPWAQLAPLLAQNQVMLSLLLGAYFSRNATAAGVAGCCMFAFSQSCCLLRMRPYSLS